MSISPRRRWPRPNVIRRGLAQAGACGYLPRSTPILLVIHPSRRASPRAGALRGARSSMCQGLGLSARKSASPVRRFGVHGACSRSLQAASLPRPQDSDVVLRVGARHAVPLPFGCAPHSSICHPPPSPAPFGHTLRLVCRIPLSSSANAHGERMMCTGSPTYQVGPLRDLNWTLSGRIILEQSPCRRAWIAIPGSARAVIPTSEPRLEGALDLPVRHCRTPTSQQ